jgi:hypothetical protein
MNAIGAEPNDWDKNFKLMTDIDLLAYSGTCFNIMGTPDTPFTGVFDGNGKKISKFARTSAGKKYIGLFGQVSGENAQIKNLGLIAPNVDAGTENCVGPLVGFLRSGTITGCYVQGGSVEGALAVGGLVGSNAGMITNCYSTATVSGDTYVGGLAGHNGGTITNCYSAGSVGGNQYVAGLVGFNGGTITNCYSAGGVKGNEYLGGLVGAGSPNRVTASFWDTQKSGQTTSDGGTGKTTAEMQTAATFFEWGTCGNEGVWTIDDVNDYPRLAWEHKPGQLLDIRLSDFLAGTGSKDDPYLIYTAEDIDTIARFPCERYKDFKLRFVAGEGTRDSPYLVYTVHGLNLVGMCRYERDAHFKLMADIELSAYTGTAFNMIGSESTAFAGVFDGNDHTISNFSYTCNGTYNIGLFGYVSGPNSVIKNLKLTWPNIDAGTGDSAGALVGYLAGGTIANCHIDGGSISGDQKVGGLVGTSYEGTITDCNSTATVSGKGSVGGLVGWNKGTITYCDCGGHVLGDDNVGGLVGHMAYGSITHCYSACTVSGDASVGGLVGGNSQCSMRRCWGGLITECYSTGAVTGGSSVGGLLGHNSRTVSQCYSAGAVSGSENVGGLVGWGGADTTACFWDLQTSGQATSAAGTGKTTAEMQMAKTFLDDGLPAGAGWDFVNVWGLGENQTYPYLRKYSAADINQDASVNFLDLALLAENWLTGIAP